MFPRIKTTEAMVTITPAVRLVTKPTMMTMALYENRLDQETVPVMMKKKRLAGNQGFMVVFFLK